MNRRSMIAVAGIVLILTAIVFSKSVKKEEPKEVHYHAGFVVFDNTQKVDFSDSKYMSVFPCEIEGEEKEKSVEEIQIEKAHLHDGVGDVVHVEAENSKWRDLFTNLDYEIDYASVSAYLNGNPTQNFQDLPITAYDSLVLFTGDVDQNLLPQAVSKDRIIEVEATSVECGD
jgi:hypothetical protein